MSESRRVYVTHLDYQTACAAFELCGTHNNTGALPAITIKINLCDYRLAESGALTIAS